MDLIELKKIVCPICNNWQSKRFTSFEQHLQNEHQTTTKELWCKLNGGAVLCKCGCGGEPSFLNWWKGYRSVIVGHNGNIYKLYDFEIASEISRKRSKKLTGKKGWCHGLTAENDSRIAERAKKTSIGRKAAFDEGTIKIWSKGQTKETDLRIAKFAKETSERFASGESVPWSKGLTKETDSRITAMGLKVSLALKIRSIKERLNKLKRLSPDEIKSRITQSGRLEIVEVIGEFTNDITPNIIIKCKVCDTQREDNLQHLQYDRCFHCNPNSDINQAQITEFIKTFNVPFEEKCKTILSGRELDLYLPESKFAIDYNSLYWHNELRKSNAYHENKTLECKAKGIRLLHIFEDEWQDKNDIIKSLISFHLGKNLRELSADDCSVVQLTKNQRYEFFEANHIDGDTVIDATGWGLIFKDEIVAAINIRKPFHKSQTSLEVSRFCMAKHTNVVGGFAKLIETAIEYARNSGYNSLMSYVDTRYDTGAEHESVGFRYKRRTPPRFWWYHERTKSRFNRFKYRASKSEGLSEAEVAAEAGVVKIWGCSNLVYELVIN